MKLPLQLPALDAYCNIFATLAELFSTRVPRSFYINVAVFSGISF